MGARFIYRNRSDPQFYDASRGEMRGGSDKVIVYVNGVLCAMDREARITVPVSRWKLAKIGVACFWAALRGERAATRSPKAASVSEPNREALHPVTLSEPLPEAEQQESDAVRWERLMQEMRDLSR
jgi:type IV secretory pathway TrbD component